MTKKMIAIKPDSSWLGVLSYSRNLFCGLICLAGFCLVHFWAVAEAITEIDLRVGYSNSVFGSANMEDARIALKVWLESRLAEKGVQYQSVHRFYENTDTMAEAFRNNEIDMVTIHCYEFIQLRKQAPIEAEIVGYQVGEKGGQYVLLTSVESGVEELSDLAGKTLIMDDGLSMEVPLAWLDVQCFHAGLPRAKDLFANIQRVSKPQKAVLPVFFNKYDAAIARYLAYETMCEMNPQLGKKLKILGHSEAYNAGVVCFHKDYPEDKKKLVVDTLLGLRNDIKGQQLLLLFQVDDITTFQESDVTTLEKLYDEHQAAFPTEPKTPEPEHQ